MDTPTAMLSGVECETCETSRHSAIAPSQARHAAPSPMLMQVTSPPLWEPLKRVRFTPLRILEIDIVSLSERVRESCLGTTVRLHRRNSNDASFGA